MAKTSPIRVFTAFDYEHDESLRNLLVGQSKNPDSPFEMLDWSVKEPFLTKEWKIKVREKIRKVDQVIVLCGEYTHKATGVSVELEITKEEGKPYFLLWGYSSKKCTKPKSASINDKIYRWSWDNLKALLAGNR